MKNIITVLIIIFFQSYGLAQTTSQLNDTKEYKNEVYKFCVKVPNDWKLYGQIVDDKKNQKAIVDWGLPPIYSELEKTNIENSISITAYKKNDINSVEELIAFEYLRINPRETALEIDTKHKNARIIYFSKNGLEYKGKSYYVFKNGISYIVNFMATHGTFDKNVGKFEDFYNQINFL